MGCAATENAQTSNSTGRNARSRNLGNMNFSQHVSAPALPQRNMNLKAKRMPDDGQLTVKSG
jgi:hypothetical protein